MTNDTSPHENEYLAAIAGMSEHTISPGVTTLRDGHLHTTYAVGDRICWLEKGRGTLNGVVVEVLTDDTYHVRRHVPDKGNEHFAVTAEQIVPF
jgi:ABC-type hemin transport system ATPase subunit